MEEGVGGRGVDEEGLVSSFDADVAVKFEERRVHLLFVVCASATECRVICIFFEIFVIFR